MNNTLISLSPIHTRSESPGLPIRIQFADAAGESGPGQKSGDIWFTDPPNGAESAPDGIVNLSLGRRKALSQEVARRSGGELASWLIRHRFAHVEVEAHLLAALLELHHLQAFFEGLLLGSFRFQNYQTRAKSSPEIQFDILNPDGEETVLEAVGRAAAIAGGVNLARSWGHEPPNVLNPVSLAARLKTLAATRNLRYEALGPKELQSLGAGALLATGAGSNSPPQLIVLEHRYGPGDRPVVIVGKAITFDSGGITLKSRAALVGMKYDKSGGLAVAGIMDTIAALNLDLPVVGLISAAENMISQNAYRPNDIVTSLSGQTIEIISTDAEGRMVLADALTYGSMRYQARAIVDLASLTSGVVTALGKVRAGLFSNNGELADALIRAGERTDERLWQLPLDDDYFKLIRGDDSDLKNSSLLKQATAVIGAKFLEQFVMNDIPWAHLDIAGTHKTPRDGPYTPKGATGFGVRLIVEALETFARN